MKILKITSIAVLFIVIIGFTYEHISRIYYNEQYKPYGEFVDIDGHKLNYIKKGSSGPTVIFETGHTLTGHVDWIRIQEKLPEDFTTISYSRAGLLWSERGNNRITSKNIGNDLKKLLEKTNCPKPYILVGHSFAGITLRDFIVNNEDDIKNIIFIDALNPNMYERTKPNMMPKQLMTFFSEIGLARIFMKYNYPNTDKTDIENQVSNNLMHLSMKTNIEEIHETYNISLEAMKLDFPNIPLTIIAPYDYMAKNPTSEISKWQKNLLTISSESELIIAKKSGHMVHWEEPNLIIDKIMSLVEKE